MVTTDQIYDRLKTVIDPELNVDIVSLGLIYEVEIKTAAAGSVQPTVHVLMTLTTPGCPLSAVFDSMVRNSLRGIDGVDADQDVVIELTFDPPWTPDMMSAEARAELGFD